MASVTGGHEFERWTGDLEPRVLATDLLKREGCPLEPATPRTRRAIGGMAVGAVLTFGAVVGTLIPHSGAPAGNGANLADQQVSYPGETSQQAPADAAPVVVTPAAEINNNDATTVAAAQSAATQQAAPDRQSSAHRGGSAGGYATPATYSVHGRQYVVIACGGGKMGTKSGDAYVAFALPPKP